MPPTIGIDLEVLGSGELVTKCTPGNTRENMFPMFSVVMTP